MGRDRLRGHPSDEPPHQRATRDPAPTAYRVLGNLYVAGHMLPQLFTQLGAGLSRSLDDREIQIYDRNREPPESAQTAATALQAAAEHARATATAALEEAPLASNAQGYEHLEAGEGN